MLDEVAPVDQRTAPAPIADRLAVGLAQVSVALEGLMLTEGAL